MSLHSIDWDENQADKKTALKAAKYFRKKATKHLEEAERLADKLPIDDWRIRDRLKVLVSSAMASTFISNPKEKILAIAMPLIIDLAVNEVFDRIETCKDLFLEFSGATSCLEMSNHYNRLSIGFIHYGGCWNRLYGSFNLAIDDLTRLDIMTAGLRYQIHGAIISSYITEFRDELIEYVIKGGDFEDGEYHGHFNRKMQFLLENFDEIIADRSPVDGIIGNIMYNRLELAANHLKDATDLGYKKIKPVKKKKKHD